MKNKTILIVDGLAERRNAMIKAFIGLSNLILYRLAFNDGQTALQLYDENLGFWENQDSLPSRVDLMLIHGRDDAYKGFVPATKRIWYGGYTGSDPRAPEGEESITRPIEKAKEAIDRKDAEQFIAYLDGGSQPACLNPDGYDEQTDRILAILKLLLNPDAKDQEVLFIEHYSQLKSCMRREIGSVKENALKLLKSKGMSVEQRIGLVRKIRQDLLQAAH